MLTPFLGNMGVGHHTGRKVYTLPGDQVFAWAGDLGHAMRVKLIAEAYPAHAAGYANPFAYPLDLSQAINSQFTQTQVLDRTLTACFVGFPQGGQAHCCVLTGGMQPLLFDQDHYYMALGSGKLSADPFLKFLVDIFCCNAIPTVNQAAFLATWTVQHSIDTTQGYVAGPICVAVLETTDAGLTARELSAEEIETHKQSKADAEQALRDWRDQIQSGEAAADAPPVPQPEPVAANGGGVAHPVQAGAGQQVQGQ
jgi:hypothetical protein